ncbi:MAG: hypothetical protein QNK05_11315 [Myxococcota bacterium]|nr:hypothetical protein [Myxococcota bacterium]
MAWLVLAIIPTGCSFLDGPVAIFPGGSLTSGDWVDAPVSDWSFAAEAEEVELQLAGEDSSRTTWIIVHERQAYIPCNLEFPPFKTWHERALVDGAAIVRIDGKRYRVQMTEVGDQQLRHEIERTASGKYGVEPRPPDDESVLFFRLTSREAG